MGGGWGQVEREGRGQVERGGRGPVEREMEREGGKVDDDIHGHMTLEVVFMRGFKVQVVTTST